METSEIARLLFTKKSSPDEISLDRGEAARFLDTTLGLIYPRMLLVSYRDSNDVEKDLKALHGRFSNLLLSLKISEDKVSRSAIEFLSGLDRLSLKVEEDALAVMEADPAAGSLEEVVLAYPGLLAIATYRVAHFVQSLLVDERIGILTRLLSEISHRRTGIEIHPRAKIGKAFVIDHGTGVVIGETAVVGNNVKIYQGVTLGALSVEKELANKKRHPTIEDDCVIYAHATILGGETVVGKGSVIGGNVWMTRSVPANSLVYHKSEVKLDNVNKFNENQELIYEI